MWVKICGITNEEDALMAAALGADALGFNFVPTSRRNITPSAARDIVRRLPREVLTFGVFRDQAPHFVIDTVLSVGLRGAQLHGHETPAMAAEIRPKVQSLIVALSAGDPMVERFDEYGADALMLDGVNPGSGNVFDWELVDKIPRGHRLILAGGLTPDNVAAGIERVRPWGVDVATGVESLAGMKDPRLVQKFIHAARSAEQIERMETEDEAPEFSPSTPFDWNEDGDL